MKKLLAILSLFAILAVVGCDGDKTTKKTETQAGSTKTTEKDK